MDESLKLPDPDEFYRAPTVPLTRADDWKQWSATQLRILRGDRSYWSVHRSLEFFSGSPSKLWDWENEKREPFVSNWLAAIEALGGEVIVRRKADPTQS